MPVRRPRVITVITHEKITPWQACVIGLAKADLILGIIITLLVVMAIGVAVANEMFIALGVVCSGFGPGIFGMICGALGVIGYRSKGTSQKLLITIHFISCFISLIADFVGFGFCLAAVGVGHIYKAVTTSNFLLGIEWLILLAVLAHVIFVLISILFVCITCLTCCKAAEMETESVVYVRRPAPGANRGVTPLEVRSLQSHGHGNRVPPHMAFSSLAQVPVRHGRQARAARSPPRHQFPPAERYPHFQPDHKAPPIYCPRSPESQPDQSTQESLQCTFDSK